MTFLLFLLQFDKLKPENIFGGQVLERVPAGLSIVYLIGASVLILFLLVSFYRAARPKFAFEENLPRQVVKRLSLTFTNRSLKIWQFVFICLTFAVFGFHVYWTYFAESMNEKYREVSNKDLRSRRTSASTMRGWMLDRTGKLENALASYKVDKDGKIDRVFRLDTEMAHLLGTERGTPGLERTLYQRPDDPMPEAWEILTKIKSKEPENKDVRITIDGDLQKYVAEKLAGKKGAIVVLNPQNGDVLAMYSNPSYKLSEAESLEGYYKLENQKEENPLLNRVTREFYIPGSIFKTFTMLSSFRAGGEDLTFPGRPGPECYTPFKGSRPICDVGTCHGCGEAVPLREAFMRSSNQYFAQLANHLGRDRMGETAKLVGIMPVETTEEALTQGFYSDIWNTSNERIANSISLKRATMVTGKQLTLYDFGLEGIGQGLAGQMTPFQMALVAAAAGNLEGNLMKPRIEADVQPKVYNKIINSQQAAQVRDIMSTVTEEADGTADVVSSKLGGTGIVTGGKTGTAEKDNVPVYNKDGTRKTETKRRKNDKGEWEEYQDPVSRRRKDGWFIVIAPLENPQVAIAVLVEDIGPGGFGGTTAAPIAADVILKASQLGLLGDKYKPTTSTNKKRNER